MTTIAYKEGTLVSDGHMVLGTTLVSRSYKKVFDVEGEGLTILGEEVLAYAVAGFVRSRLVLHRLLQEGVDTTTVLETGDDFGAIVVTPTTAYHVDKDGQDTLLNLIEIFEGEHYAIGSGKTVANHVLMRGGDPLEAVIEAAKTDIGTGGETYRYARPKA